MPLSGKYNFQGLKKLGAANFRLALASSPATAWILKGGAITNYLLEWLSNWMANKGLVTLNMGYDYVDGHLDRRAWDHALDAAIEEIKIKGGRDALTPEQKKAIDDEVIKAGRDFIIIARPK